MESWPQNPQSGQLILSGSAPWTGYEIGERYVLVQKLGEGGEAQVYSAWQKTANRWVAVRFPLTTPSAVPPTDLPGYYVGWVRCWELGRDFQLGEYQVLELLTGPTLGKLISQDGPIPTFPLGREFIIHSLNSVSWLHANRWLHGDIHAENFIYQQMAEEDFRNVKMWKLLELPFLSFFPENRHKPAFGSIHTMAPERLQGKEPDFRSDFYSLGCLYYYALTGRYPHMGSEADIAIGHLRFDPAPITATVEISRSLENWIARMMAKDPAMRFQTAGDAKQALGHVFGQIMPRTWV